MGHLPVSPLTRLCPWQPQGGILLLDLPSEQNHSWTFSAASNGCRKGMGLLESDSASLGSVGCDRAGPAFLPRWSTGVGRFVSPRPAGIQLAGYSGASAGQRGASGWVRLCGHGVQRVPGIPASSLTGSHTASSCPDVPSSHKCLTVDAVGLFSLLQTVLYQGGSSRIQAGLQLGCDGEQPLTPLSLGQGYLARKELILSSLMHSNQDLALRNQSPSFSQPWEDLAVGLLVCGRKWAVPMQTGPGEQKLSKLHLGTARESLENRGIAQIRAAAAWGTVRTAVAGNLFSAASP